MSSTARVSPKGARRWESGHPWIYRSDLVRHPDTDAGATLVENGAGAPLGWALWSPRSEISLRLLDRSPSARIDAAWWRARLERAIARRATLRDVANAFRLVHGEADGCPSLICDRYDRWLVVQLLSAGLERFRDDIVRGADRPGRVPTGFWRATTFRSAPRKVWLARRPFCFGSVPREIEVTENGVRYLAAPWDGQKTGAFLDQRENRALVGAIARGRALDCFSYHGSFALHLAQRATSVVALDASSAALERARENAARNELRNIDFVEADAFEWLRAAERRRERFDTIVLDPPAFAKTRSALPAALRGYKEINLRAMRLLASGGMLFTASCSYHLTKPLFLEVIEAAAADSGRRIAIRELRGQPLDHPEVLSIPETGYLKGALLEALD